MKLVNKIESLENTIDDIVNKGLLVEEDEDELYRISIELFQIRHRIGKYYKK